MLEIRTVSASGGELGLDTILPGDIAQAMEVERQRSLRKPSGYRVVSDGREHAVVRLRKSGFVIEADGRPPLRGYADVMHGDDRVLRGLVVCIWARDGQVGYEFKREGGGLDVPVDYVRPNHAGLLDAPN